MDLNTVVTLIQGVGFPIAMCLIMGWYVKYITDRNREELANERDTHKQEMNEITTAINNNTLVLEKLLNKLGDDSDA